MVGVAHVARVRRPHGEGVDADAARGRAAEVYEHFAAEVKAAKLPGNLPEEEAKLQVLVMEKIAGEYERKAKELRANAP